MARATHQCFWPGCTQQVPLEYFGCRRHWFTLPRHYRDQIWDTYKPGQPASAAHLKNLGAAIQWSREYERSKRETPPEQGTLNL